MQQRCTEKGSGKPPKTSKTTGPKTKEMLVSWNADAQIQDEDTANEGWDVSSDFFFNKNILTQRYFSLIFTFI